MKREEFEKKLRDYAKAVAGIVAVAPAGVILGAGNAEAKIQYFPQNITVDSSNSFTLVDINNDGNDDFLFSYSNDSYIFVGTGYYSYSNWVSLNGSGVINTVIPRIGANSYNLPINLATGYLIQNTLNSYTWQLSQGYSGYGLLVGNRYGPQNGYFTSDSGCLGVRFNTAQGTRYGWVGITGTNDSINITGWAYENTGAPIRACDTGQITSVPTLNQWGAFALIALLAGGGAVTLRRRKNTA